MPYCMQSYKEIRSRLYYSNNKLQQMSEKSKTYRSSMSLSAPCSVPPGNDHGPTGQLSFGNKLLNSCVDRSRWLELLYENILQSG